MKVKNLQTVTNALQKYGKDIEKGVQDAVQRNTELMESEALQNKPTNTIEPIEIRSTVEGLVGIVSAFSGANNSDVPIYYEVGTGLSYLELAPRLTPAQRAIALTAYKNGKGTIKPHPYMFPAFMNASKRFKKDIQKVIKNRTK